MKQNFNNQMKKDLIALEETKFVFLCNQSQSCPLSLAIFLSFLILYLSPIWPLLCYKPDSSTLY